MWLFCAFLAAILWGLNYSLAEKILRSISPMTLLALEMLSGALVFFILGYATQLKGDIALLATNRELRWLVSIETIVALLASVLIVFSIQAKNATVAGIIELIYPLFTIFFTAFLFHESHLNISVVIGGGLILIGVVIISFA